MDSHTEFGGIALKESCFPHANLSELEKIFPHVPKAAFKGMVEKEVDILVGLNMSHIMPEGGSGVDKSGGIRVKRSKFGCGWVVGGVLSEDMSKPIKHSLSSHLLLSGVLG